ncbi:hypothetical protein BDA99DRAFT_608261 [Phascolomyces articulosus]|uniref:Polyketide synthase-like phosphopantetheine-binding domain-containing protein n=1 Tax=Phascolomyces articulosus TaxID=60185 RepID=A0AAD5JRG7_9FUNG|nr:hypothetical protein BDA99DRAFT_608261 [Phascolomyces articulosus]
MTYAEADRIASNLAYEWAPMLKDVESVGFIADHSIYYLVAMLAVFKLRPILLALSPRNSVAANVNLLTQTNSKFMIVSEKYADMAQQCHEQVSGGCDYKVLASLDLDTLSSYAKDYHSHVSPPSEKDIEKVALIIHSSGSTSFPKPIYLSNRYLFWLIQGIPSQMKKNSQNALVSSDVVLSPLPLFHIFGILSQFMGIIFGASSLIFGHLPPSPRNIFEAVEEFGVTVMAQPPVGLEAIAQYIEDTQSDVLRQLKFCLYGGAPLRKRVGDYLNARGINVRSAYGTTEINAMAVANVSQDWKNNWSCLKAVDPIEPYCYWEPYDESRGIYHLIIHRNCPTMATNVSNRPDGDYSTNDLFIEDPPKSRYFRHLGRNDDILVMQNGEKTNPVPMEHQINSAKVVRCCTVLGEGRQCTAALVELDLEQAMHYSPKEMISQVEEAVDRANKVAPNYSTILPQMIYILPLNQHLPTTVKGNVIRKRAMHDFKAHIDQMYDDFLQGPSTTTSTTKDQDNSDLGMGAFLMKSASDTLQKSDIDPKKSLFDYGLNSLLAIQLRNRIATRFDNVPSNFIFENPTLVMMKEALEHTPKDQGEQRETKYHDTQVLLEEYLQRANVDFPVAATINKVSKDEPQTILLTGATGSLGAFILRDLILSPQVKKIYCLVRGKNLMQRVEKSFQDRMLDTSLLKNKVEALPMKLDDPYLGWDEATYNQLKNEVTIVQHCAWLLDFNQPVQYFDRECIHGLYNLLKFAYRQENPMHMHAISSISATATSGQSIVPEQPPPNDPHCAMPMGYAQSKYIVEHLFDYLTKNKNFPCTIERTGQVSGDSNNGVWNISEQYPIVMVSGAQLGYMPNLAKVNVDWIPVDYAAAAIVEIMLNTVQNTTDESKQQDVFHIVNPSRVHWSDVLKAMQASGMNFKVIDPDAWVDVLRKHQESPAYRLMSFFEANFAPSNKEKVEANVSMPVWATDRTVETAPVLGKAPAFNANLLKKYLTFWQSVGFYHPSIPQSS